MVECKYHSFGSNDSDIQPRPLQLLLIFRKHEDHQHIFVFYSNILENGLGQQR